MSNRRTGVGGRPSVDVEVDEEVAVASCSIGFGFEEAMPRLDGASVVRTDTVDDTALFTASSSVRLTTPQRPCRSPSFGDGLRPSIGVLVLSHARGGSHRSAARGVAHVGGWAGARAPGGVRVPSSESSGACLSCLPCRPPSSPQRALERGRRSRRYTGAPHARLRECRPRVMAKKGRSRAAPRKGGLQKAQNGAASSRKDHLKKEGVIKKPKRGGEAKSSKKHSFKRKADAAAAEAGGESGVIPHG